MDINNAPPQIALHLVVNPNGSVTVNNSQVINADILQTIMMLAVAQNEFLVRFKLRGEDAGMTLDQMIDAVAATAKTAINTDINRIDSQKLKN